MKESHSFDYTKEKLLLIEQKINKQIEALGGNIILTKMCEELSKIYKEKEKKKKKFFFSF